MAGIALTECHTHTHLQNTLTHTPWSTISGGHLPRDTAPVLLKKYLKEQQNNSDPDLCASPIVSITNGM